MLERTATLSISSDENRRKTVMLCSKKFKQIKPYINMLEMLLSKRMLQRRATLNKSQDKNRRKSKMLFREIQTHQILYKHMHAD